MTPDALYAEWAIIARFLPENWREESERLGAIRIDKGITDPETLLRILLMHVGTGLSLKSTVERARAQGLASLSHVALFKRLRTAGPWLASLGQRVFAQTRFVRVRRGDATRRIRAIDATTIEETGDTGSSWRVHYSVALPELACDFYAVTNDRGCETFTRVPVDAGDIILGDRGYAHRKGVAYVVARDADVVVRINATNFPLLKPDGTPFSILEHLRTLAGFKPHAWPVRFKSGGKTYRGRLCAVRKTEKATLHAQKKATEDSRRHGRSVTPDTLESAGYILVFTTLRRAEMSLKDVLELYRARWQIELVFKRMKSLLKLGHLAKRSNASSRAWLQAKLLVALLVERLAEDARLFSPWGHDGAAPEPVA